MNKSLLYIFAVAMVYRFERIRRTYDRRLPHFHFESSCTNCAASTEFNCNCRNCVPF